ncbi:hypothetical protein PN465_12560 [Nodularia spumigena CS-584]|nr:hypothetical protein [Nodularia spumigena]AHJ26872.1 hypothetical protein NSP_5220 [Nodularia spumigena CCY9414]MDB9383044.1 hypothetical protein [Nodularia spumigena CS-584]MEA5556552.1 hypothetical protein [Nodularia spumigena CH309]
MATSSSRCFCPIRETEFISLGKNVELKAATGHTCVVAYSLRRGKRSQ